MLLLGAVLLARHCLLVRGLVEAEGWAPGKRRWSGSALICRP